MDVEEQLLSAPASTRVVINAPNGHKLKAAVSHAVRVGNLVYVSGTPGYTGNRELAIGDFATQFRQAMANIQTILAHAGTSFDRAVKVNAYIVRESDFWTMDEIYRSYFDADNFPARTTIVTALAIPNMLVEIEVIAEC